MTMVADQKVECKKCGTVYERLKIYSMSINPGKISEETKKMLKEANKPCPKCGGTKVEEIDYTETTRERIKTKLIQVSIILAVVIVLALIVLGIIDVVSWFV